MHFRKSVWKHNILATLFIMGSLGIVTHVLTWKIFDVFNPMEESFHDLEVTDLVFSQLREDPLPDTNIVIVNIGHLSRPQIGRQLEIIRRHNPAAVGLDVIFSNRKTDTLGDMYLAEQIRQTENIVLVSRLEVDRAGNVDSMKYSHELFSGQVTSGFANLNTVAKIQDDFKTCREFPASWELSGQNYYPFALEIARKINPDAANRFISRDKQYETINYRGNVADPFKTTNFSVSFYALDAMDILTENFDPSLIKGKVVLLGFLGSSLGDTSWDDRFYTPMNKKYAGRANPDMYGVVIHANIISMILAGNYITDLKDTTQLGMIVTVIFCMLIVSLFGYIHRRYTRYYDILTKSIQVLLVILLMYISIVSLNYLMIKLGLTLIITIVLISGDLLEVYFNFYQYSSPFFKRLVIKQRMVRRGGLRYLLVKSPRFLTGEPS